MDNSVARLVATILASILSVSAHAFPQRATEPAPDPVGLARSGDAAGAWKAWSALPDSTAKLRTGMAIAIETGEVARGIELYEWLTGKGQAADRQALRQLALAAATRLAGATPEVRMVACGSALVLDAKHAACRRALEDMLTTGADPSEYAVAGYSLLNAGIQPGPNAPGIFQARLSDSLRLQLAQTLMRLPPADRLFLIQPLLHESDAAVQYQSLLVAADIPGPETLAALRTVQPHPRVRTGLVVALARHGDYNSLKDIAERLPELGSYERIQAARALAEAGDPRGRQALDLMLAGDVELDRIQAAAALVRLNPDAAVRVLTQTLSGTGVALLPAALKAAGIVGIGSHPVVYRRLAADDLRVSAAALQAIAESLVPVKLPTNAVPRSGSGSDPVE
jgi:hypothetical protein